MIEGVTVSNGNGIGSVSEVYLMDCMEGMKQYPDKYYLVKISTGDKYVNNSLNCVIDLL